MPSLLTSMASELHGGREGISTHMPSTQHVQLLCYHWNMSLTLHRLLGRRCCMHVSLQHVWLLCHHQHIYGRGMVRDMPMGEGWYPSNMRPLGQLQLVKVYRVSTVWESSQMQKWAGMYMYTNWNSIQWSDDETCILHTDCYELAYAISRAYIYNLWQ